MPSQGPYAILKKITTTLSLFDISEIPQLNLKLKRKNNRLGLPNKDNKIPKSPKSKMPQEKIVMKTKIQNIAKRRSNKFNN
jgi:hypothetical protein